VNWKGISTWCGSGTELERELCALYNQVVTTRPSRASFWPDAHFSLGGGEGAALGQHCPHGVGWSGRARERRFCQGLLSL